MPQPPIPTAPTIPADPPPLIAALRRQLGAQLEETHASWVLLTEREAWKIKKPVTLPFLDYGSLAKREAACREELRLNRRLAPALYLDVLPIGGSAAEPRPGALPAIEWAVRMQRFAATARLDRLAALGALGHGQFAQLAHTLADFQARAAVAPADGWLGSPAQVQAPALENFAELRHLLPAARAQVEQLAAWTVEEFAAHRADFAARLAQGRVREGHGDLHLANLALIDGVVTPFDGIEFNAELRWIDVASEIAFTWVDLLDHGQAGLAAGFLSAWREASGDTGALAPMRYYAVYRAVVRAKVAAIRAAQEGEAGAAAADRALAEDYLRLAARCAASPAPSLCITVGLSGSGKSTAAAAWVAGASDGRRLRLRADVERKRLFGLAPLAASHSAVGAGLYSAEANARTYAHLGEQAAQMLAHGWSVVIDAACLRRAERAAFRALAHNAGATFSILAPHAEPAELHRRLAARQGDPSEATSAVLERQLTWFEPLDEEEQALCVNQEV